MAVAPWVLMRLIASSRQPGARRYAADKARRGRRPGVCRKSASPWPARDRIPGSGTYQPCRLALYMDYSLCSGDLVRRQHACPGQLCIHCTLDYHENIRGPRYPSSTISLIGRLCGAASVEPIRVRALSMNIILYYVVYTCGGEFFFAQVYPDQTNEAPRGTAAGDACLSTRVSRPSWRPSYVIQNTFNECSGVANGLSGA